MAWSMQTNPQGVKERRMYAMLDGRWTYLEPQEYHRTWMAYTALEGETRREKHG